MTATIIEFPGVKRSPTSPPLSRKELLEQIFGPEDVTARMSPRLSRQERLRQIFRTVATIQEQGLGPEDGVSPRLLRLAELIPRKHEPDGDTVA